MPYIRKCINHEFCRGYCDGNSKLCNYCQEVKDKYDREAAIQKEYFRLIQKPSRNSHEKKAGVR